MHTFRISIRPIVFAAFFMLCAFRLPAQTVTVPFALNLGCSNQFPTSVCDSVYTVPANQHLEIKNLNVDCDAPSGSTVLSLVVSATVGGVLTGITPALPATKLAIPNATFASMRFMQMVEMYADPSSKMTLMAELNEVAPTQQFDCVVSLQGLRTAPIGSVLAPSGPNR
jgi:hypothetical protein